MKKLFLLLSALFPLFSDIPTLTLSANAAIHKPSDELQMKIGVVTLATTAESALFENSTKMQDVIENLNLTGLTTDDYETSHFSINPTYTPYPLNPPLDWKPSINGYEVTNTILIHTPKLNLAGKIIDVAHRSGANSITEVRFALRNPRDYWTEALTAAGANAVKDAQAIASATGVRLVRVRSISLNHTHVSAPQLNIACIDSRGSAPPIEPGEVSITANVTLVYEID
jgi:hypothetical protein